MDNLARPFRQRVVNLESEVAGNYENCCSNRTKETTVMLWDDVLIFRFDGTFLPCENITDEELYERNLVSKIREALIRDNLGYYTSWLEDTLRSEQDGFKYMLTVEGGVFYIFVIFRSEVLM